LAPPKVAGVSPRRPGREAAFAPPDGGAFGLGEAEATHAAPTSDRSTLERHIDEEFDDEVEAHRDAAVAQLGGWGEEGEEGEGGGVHGAGSVVMEVRGRRADACPPRVSLAPRRRGKVTSRAALSR
jgi:hypothetical protein